MVGVAGVPGSEERHASNDIVHIADRAIRNVAGTIASGDWMVPGLISPAIAGGHVHGCVCWRRLRGRGGRCTRGSAGF